MEIIQRINDLLNQKGISGYKMSRDLGFSSGLYSQWNKGIQKPKIDKVTKIAEYLGVSVDYLMGNEKKPTGRTGELWERLDSIITQLEDEDLDNLVKQAELLAAFRQMQSNK